MRKLVISDYRSLAELRYQIRRFSRFSEEAARKTGIEPRQHQLLLTIKGLPDRQVPRIGVLAERLQIEPHSAVELANRLAKKGYVQRQRDGDDRREVLLKLTPKGERLLGKLSLDHHDELLSAGPALMAALRGVLKGVKPGSSKG